MVRIAAMGPGDDDRRDAALAALKAVFLAAVTRGRSTADSPALWRAMIENAWFQRQLDRAVVLALFEVDAPLAWRDDVRNHALLLLRAELDNPSSLKLDLKRAQASFAGWLKSVLRHVCQRAVRYQLRQARPHSEVTANDPARPADLALFVDVALAIDTLDEPARSLMSLMMDGHSLVKAAESLGLSRKCARTTHAKAMERLRRALHAYEE
jgi:hypothetical protein